MLAGYSISVHYNNDIFVEYRYFDTYNSRYCYIHYNQHRKNILNLLVPFGFFAVLLPFGQDLSDMLRISLLHLVIGVFAFFMAAIFKQGQLLQEEQDLTL